MAAQLNKRAHRDKMYKGRLKAWGLMKNLKSRDADQIMGMAKSGTASGPLVIRGRNMGSKKWQKRLNRVVAPELKENLAQSRRNSIIFTLPPTAYVGQPDTFRLTEAGLQAIRDFTTRQFQTQAWDLSTLPYDFDSDKTDGWQNGTMLATQNLVKDRSSASNFAILSKCFEAYGAVVDQATPALVPCTISSVIQLLRVGPDVADSLLRYAAALINIKLGNDHPLSRFLSQMQTLGAAQVPLIARAILSAYFDIIVTNSHPANRWRSAVYPTYAKMMQNWGALPREAVGVIFGKTIKDIELMLDEDPTNTIDSEQMDRHLKEVKIYFAVYLTEQRRFDEADEIAEELSIWMQEGGAEKFPEQYEQLLRIKARILVGLERPDEATEYYVKTYVARRDRLGIGHHRTTRAISELEEHYRSLNDIEAAEKLHAEFEASYSNGE